MKKVRTFCAVRLGRKPSSVRGPTIRRSGTYEVPLGRTVIEIRGPGGSGAGAVSSVTGVGCFGDRLILEGRAGGHSLFRTVRNSRSTHARDDE